ALSLRTTARRAQSYAPPSTASAQPRVACAVAEPPITLPTRGSAIRALVVLPLVIAPALALPTFLSTPMQTRIWCVEAVIAIFALGLFAGQTRVVRQLDLSSARVTSALAFPLSSLTRALALVLIVAGAGFAFVPNNLQFGKAPVAHDSATLPAVREVDPVHTVSGRLGATINDGANSYVIDNNSANASALDHSSPAPKGFRWVSVVVRVKPGSQPLDVLHASIRLVDATQRSYLPDMGEGVQNAVLGVVKPGAEAFWTPAYLVPISTSPMKVVVTSHPGATVEIEARYPVRAVPAAANQRLRLTR
ncbi:MAG: hypothetical protein JWN41_1668, partial [Thermoleophilia bacterium]|nr:hypothetical protein [Thermoleophilia bacterium]